MFIDRGVEMKRSIVYLDDDRGCLDVFEQTLNDEYEVRTATTPDEARRMLTERVANIIISDQSMPTLKGEEFLREVARDYPDSCRVMLTGQAVIGNMLGELSTGTINLFIPKPWLEQEMRQMLELASLPRALHSEK
jgi:DNA-binding NtrC family response regulator